jgi:DNA-binding XRE family transcriptional regulator
MSQLPNYLRAHRKRLALSQGEVAYLLGSHGGAKVCRDEKFVRQPGLETALAYAAIYQIPVEELFAGMYRRIEQEVATRAKIMTYRKEGQPNQRTRHKREKLVELVNKKKQ